MTKLKWRDVNQANYIVEKLTQIKLDHTKKSPGSVITISLNGFTSIFDVSFDKYKDILVSNYQFNIEVPSAFRGKVVTKAIFKAADKNILSSGAISEFVKTSEKNYLKKSKKTYILLSCSVRNRISYDKTTHYHSLPFHASNVNLMM